MKYRKRPVEVEAFRLGYDPMPDWFCDARAARRLDTFEGNPAFDRPHNMVHARIVTFEGSMLARDGDYIIRGIKGEIYPCKRDIFEATYERVEDNGDTAQKACGIG